VTVRGEAWLDGPCDDTGGGSPGCDGPEKIEPSQPTKGIEVTLVQDGSVIDQKTVDANDRGEFKVQFDTRDLPAGDFRIRAGTESESFRVAPRD
jgi:hypothetical protein